MVYPTRVLFGFLAHTHTHIHTRISQLPLLNKLFAQSPFSPTLIYRNRQVDSGKKKTSEETEQIYRVSLNLRVSTKSIATKKQKERMKEKLKLNCHSPLAYWLRRYAITIAWEKFESRPMGGEHILKSIHERAPYPKRFVLHALFLYLRFPSS